ncbi:MarR family winged helix-turn-helix transcriptional regulator [Nocardioides jishulii]|uniref:MarR family transcriptional regulator n=1 Tax=Nocardioides jishulii TaxID=2575440 RepID=A0A4U2YR86_9ACTN|nr:MarR family transcriptional regulator [Nocardioides jishulii]QCX26317.1 MarR family transcriptional regulator [Nocardioides jishulii]TKI63878.1 MarR family transcriptional regulator [Nocardioides jishulii]
MRQVTDALAATPVWDVLVAVSRLGRASRLAEAHDAMGTAERRLLWLLSDDQPRTMREVSEELLLEQSTVNRQVNAALAAGLVERRVEPGEQARRVALTEKGLREFAADVEKGARRFRVALEAVPADRVEEFTEMLLAFATAYKDDVEHELQADSRGH